MSGGLRVFALCLLATRASAGVQAESSKQNPVAEVVTLLEDLKTKVEDEGKSEATSYDTFGCFCKDQTKVKGDSIVKSNDEIDSLSADIQQSVADAAEKSSDLQKRKATQEELAGDLTEEQNRCLQEEAEFEADIADLSKAVKSLTKAVTAVKNAQGSSLLEVRQAVDESLMLADALSIIKPSKRSGMQAFLQQGVDPTSPEYQFHSGELLKTLEDLETEFTTKKTDKEGEFTKAKDVCKVNKGAITSKMETNAGAMTTLKEGIEALETKAAQDRETLVTTEGLLKDDQLYLKDLTSRCEARATDWDQRSAMRGKEITALTEALTILKDGKDGVKSVKEMDGAVNERAFVQLRQVHAHKATAATSRAIRAAPASFAAKEAEASGAAAPSFLQAARGLRGARSAASFGQERAASLLRQEGVRLQSGMLSALSTQVAADPFAKVKTLVQQLIERLLKEATQEATKKGFCDEEIGKASKARDFRFADVNKLTAEITSLEAKKDELEAENTRLADDITTAKDALKTAEGDRTKENEQNLETIKTAKQGAKAVAKAITILKVFYSKAGRAALLEASPVDEDTSGPGFSGSYKGQQDGATGVIGLLEVIQSDFDRTARKTKESEEAAQKAFVEFEQTSKVDIKGMETTVTLNTEELKSTENGLSQTTTDLKTAQSLLDAALKTIEDLKPMCIDTGMSFADRKAKREEEIEALKQALCLLDPEKKESECQ